MEDGKFKERQAWRKENTKRGRHGGKKIQREEGMEGRKLKERQAWREENSKRGKSKRCIRNAASVDRRW